MDLSFLQGAIQKAQHDNAEAMQRKTNQFNEGGSQQSNNPFGKKAFIPDGTHHILILPDNKGDIYYHTKQHRINRVNYLCTYHIDKNCKLCPPANDTGDWQLKSQHITYMYLYLIETTSPNKYWQPGNTYCGIEKRRLCEEASRLVSELSQNPEFFMSVMDPERPSYCLKLNKVGGTQGHVRIEADVLKETH